jgi:pimeloyl-ACP methyl ester carboxylesterase
MRSATVESFRDADMERLRRIHLRGDEQIRSLRRQFNNMQNSYTDMTFTPPHLATIRARTLIVHGDRDQHFPVVIPVEMYRSIPNSALWIIPNGGHVPIFRNAPEFVRTALEFLAAPGTAAR